LLTYPASIPLSTRSLTRPTSIICAHRRAIGSRWRKLPANRQALLILAHLRNGDTLVRLAAGFDVGIATVWRYLREGIDLLAAAADTWDQVMPRIAALAYAILDGTLIPIDRVAEDRPYYSGKHKRHGVNVQVLADAAGRLVWASPALPGATHDLTAAREHRLIDALARAKVMTFADKGYQGAGGTVWTPFKRQPRRPPPAAVPAAEGRQPSPRPHPCARRTSHRHVEDMENPGQDALLPPPRHRDRAGHPRATNSRERPLRRMKRAQGSPFHQEDHPGIRASTAPGVAHNVRPHEALGFHRPIEVHRQPSLKPQAQDPNLQPKES
jgi:hypothetical protein